MRCFSLFLIIPQFIGDKLSIFEFILTDDFCINQIYNSTNHFCNHLSKRSFLFRESNLRRSCFDCLRLQIVKKENLHCFLNQSEVKSKPLVTRSHTFSRAHVGYMYLPGFLIGSLDCLCSL